MHADPQVSIVVPCYNYGRFLTECLDSIFALEGPGDFEVLVIDDASTDETPEVLAHYADPRLHIRRHEVNLGTAASVTEGFAAARGAFVARLDADDQYAPNFLTDTLSCFASYPEVTMCYGDFAYLTTDQARGGRGGPPLDASAVRVADEFLAILADNYICTPTVICRGRALDQIPPCPGWISGLEDWYYTLSLSSRGPVGYIPRVLGYYRIHAGNRHVRDIGTGHRETATKWLLDEFCSGRHGDRPVADQLRREIYAGHYYRLGENYLGAGMARKARRCYLRSLAYRPYLPERRYLARHLSATLLGLGAYDQVKRWSRHHLPAIYDVLASAQDEDRG